MTDTPTLFCSYFSREAGEQLFGTATSVAVWFLLEYEGRWGPDAFADSDLPAPVKERLTAHLSAIPRSRLQLIRQKPHISPPGIAFFVALSRESHPALYEFRLDAYEDLLALDIPAICAEDAAYNRFRRAEPLVLVCTHGRRDRCCAQHGVPVYEELVQSAGAAVWQTSHVGGHRFAANVLCFPHGIAYGRVRASNAAAILAAYRAGQLVPDSYRGRTCYPKIAQAAEYYLRAETGITGLDAFRLAGIEQSGPDHWLVRFAAGGTTHVLHLTEEQAALAVYSSCGDAKPSAVEQVRLVQYEVRGSE